MSLKRISQFYAVLAILALVGTILIMGSSLDPLTTFITGMIGVLILVSISVVIGELAKMQDNIRSQTKIMRRGVKKRNNG